MNQRPADPIVKFQRCERWVYEEIERAIEGYFRSVRPGPYYAYWKQGSILITAQEVRPEYQLVTGERVQPGWARDYIRAWLKQLVWFLPILPAEYT